MKKQRLYRVTGISLLALVAAVPRSVLATAYTAAADGNWSAPATWGGSGYPANSGDTATINVTRTIDVDVSVAIDDLTVTGNFLQTLNASTPNTLTVNTFNSGNINNFTIGSGLSLNIAGTGLYVTRGGTVNGALNVLDGATLTYTMNQEQRGSGLIQVNPGGKIDMQSNSIYNQFDGATGLALDNDGVFEFNNSGSFRIQALTVAGDGEWRVNSGGAQFGHANQTIALTPSTATFIGNAGLVYFFQASNAVTHTLGAFTMGGSNTVQFGRPASYQINRDSTFQNLNLTSDFGAGSLDFAPVGGGAKIHAVNGTLDLISGTLTATDGGGAVLNAKDFNHTSSGATVASGVTLNISGTGSWIGSGTLTLDGVMNLSNGASLLVLGREFYGSGTLNVAAGATLTLNGSANNNRRINVDVVNDGLLISVTNNIRPFYGVVGGTGVFRAESGTFDLDASATVVTGWSGTGTLDSTATWHAQGTSVIDFFGNNNSITVIGTNATVILENGGTLLQLNGSARNALTVNGKLHVRGTSNLQFNNAQSLTVASGGLLGGDGTVTVAGGGQVDVQSGGTLAVEIDGANATVLTVAGGNLAVAGFVEVGYAANPTANEYLIATAPAITCTATTSGEAGWKAQVRENGTELWIVRQFGGTLITIR